MNPRHRCPVIDDDGFILYESLAILGYLEEKYPDSGRGRYFPDDIQERALVRRRIIEVDLYLGTKLKKIANELYMKEKDDWDYKLLSSLKDDLAFELAILEQDTQEEGYFQGDMTMFDYVLYPMLALMKRADLKHSEFHLTRIIGPGLKAWMTRVEALPFFEKTIPPHWK